MEVVEAVNKANAGLLVDALHWDEDNRGTDALKQIPETLVVYIQLCDAPRLDNPTADQHGAI